MSPLSLCLWIAVGASAVAWILSLVTNEHSWVDRLWSILPIAYVWVFAGASGLQDPRLILMAVLVTLWGVRLTYNFARKGGYARGGEDYRWAVLRSRMRPWQFQAFNLVFITLYQNAIILLITLPALTAWQHPSALGPLDILLAALFLAALAGETVADQQQWDFHAWKRSEHAAGRDPQPRFLQRGLFAWSRHPNFFFEQAQWWILFLFGAVAAGSLVQWTVLGAALLTLLFIGSTVFTESITRGRYPEYAEYQRRVSALVPLPPRRGRAETRAAAR
ncbi:DUF1295 domain-containing protein [Plantibacter flavus]|uniref:DUF1295 domain-containing protein n=1 Tax=Plantibacter flavus TaxID=150123 RepID=UPI003F5CF267